MLAASQIGLSVTIPEGAWIFPLLHSLHQMERAPRSFGIASGRHKQPLVGCTEIDIEQSIVIADGWCPRAAGIVAVGIPSRLVES